ATVVATAVVAAGVTAAVVATAVATAAVVAEAGSVVVVLAAGTFTVAVSSAPPPRTRTVTPVPPGSGNCSRYRPFTIPTASSTRAIGSLPMGTRRPTRCANWATGGDGAAPKAITRH